MAAYRFNLLIDELPSTVTVDGSSFSINTDFRYGLLFHQCIEDEEISSEQKLIQALEIGYTDEIPDNYEEAFKQLVKFYSCLDLDGRSMEDLENDTDKQAEDNDEEEQESDYIFDYDKDSLLIYSTFFQVYNIDLVESELHWYKFIALLRSLFDENNLTKVLQFRAMKIDSKLSPEMKKYYTNMKKHYSLNKHTDREKNDIKKKMMEEWG